MIINPANGTVEFAKVFDTYKHSNSFDDFIFKGIPEGYIVAAACKDECVTQLSLTGKLWFETMGSEEIG